MLNFTVMTAATIRCIIHSRRRSMKICAVRTRRQRRDGTVGEIRAKSIRRRDQWVEVAGGSIRIHRRDVQSARFQSSRDD